MRRSAAAWLLCFVLPALAAARQQNVEVEELQPPPAEPVAQQPPPTPAPELQAATAPGDYRTLALQAEQKYNEGDLAGAALLYRQAADAATEAGEKVRLLVT